MTPIMLDSVVAILMILSIVFSFFRGFVREMLTIVNIVGASAAAYYFSPALTPTFEQWFTKEGVAKGSSAAKVFGVFPPDVMGAFSAYAAVFFGVFLILTLAGLYISGTIKAMGLGPADKTLGLIFGAVRGFFIVFIFYLPFAYFMVPSQYPDWAKDSISVHVLHKAYETGQEYMKPKEGEEVAKEDPVDPESIAGKLKKMADDAKNKARSHINEAADQAAEEEAVEEPAATTTELAPDEQAEQLP